MQERLYPVLGVRVTEKEAMKVNKAQGYLN
jgi:hypothetical protein